MTPRHVAVIDIGKSNVKLALEDTRALSEMTVVTRPNSVLPGPPYPHFDVDGHWDFLLDALGKCHAAHRIDAISITTHGACGALVAEDGHLAAPILDYEYSGPDDTSDAYEALRPDFAETGSPRLPMGLNLGAQIFWQFQQDPSLRQRTRAFVTYPQYWGYRLTGNLACDPSSLGCHTDLWNPYAGQVSSLADRLGITQKIARPRKSSEVLGPLLPEIAARTGLRVGTPVLCGIHDSNASLLPHVMGRQPPFSVISTGTWVIAMTMGGAEVTLDPTRDTLVNVNALGAPVASARFMGGREFELASGGHGESASGAAMADMAANGPMLMPAIVSDSGPFQGCTAHWIGPEPAPGTAERAAALGFYLGMMTAECLSLTGHRGDIIVEGPFSSNTAYLAMLAAATSSPVLLAGGTTGTSQGAAMLALQPGSVQSQPADKAVAAIASSALADHAGRWRDLAHAARAT